MFQPIRIAAIGGGPNSFIFKTAHLPALRVDGLGQLVAGVFSRDYQKSQSMADVYGIDVGRIYPSVAEMFIIEKQRPDGIQAVVIATPNDSHVEFAIKALEAGMHVFLDKPMAINLQQANQLALAASACPGQIVVITHNYTLNPMAIMGRELVLTGEIGNVRYVDASYIQGWLAVPIERDGQKQADWRTDPARAGAGALGDIGVHAAIQALWMSGLVPTKVRGQLRTFVEGRKIDDWMSAELDCDNGATIRLHASQIAHGRQNDLRVAICGTNGTIEWKQEYPNQLLLLRNGEPVRIYERGGCEMTPQAAQFARYPGGHPEGYGDGFANVYRSGIYAILEKLTGEYPAPERLWYPGVEVGLAGNDIIDAIQRSSSILMGGETAPNTKAIKFAASPTSN